MKAVFRSENKLHPLLIEVIELINQKITSLSDLRALMLEPKLAEKYANLNEKDLFINNEFYQAKGFRRIHLEVAKLGKSLQILHCVFFPDPRYDLPIFGLDIVIVSNSISAAIVDLSPVGIHTSDFIRTQMKLIKVPKFKEIKILPDWGDIFSPYVCFIRPVDPCEEKLFYNLINDYLSILFSLVLFVRRDEINSTNMIKRSNYQKRYCLNQKRNDKTRLILTRFFGASWADEYIDSILFDY